VFVSKKKLLVLNLIKTTHQSEMKSEKTIEETSGCARPEWANKWPNPITAA